MFLPPRQEEIYNIIKDHIVTSFDMIQRRFLKVPERTLRYDLKKLVDQGLISDLAENPGIYARDEGVESGNKQERKHVFSTAKSGFPESDVNKRKTPRFSAGMFIEKFGETRGRYYTRLENDIVSFR